MIFHLKRVREERGISIRQLAKISNVGKKSIERIEASAVNPSIGMLCKLAKALDVNVTDLFDCE